MRRNQRALGVLLIVEAKVALVGVVGEGDLLGVVVGREAGGRRDRTGAGQEMLLEVADDLLREGIDGAWRESQCRLRRSTPVIGFLTGTTRMPLSSFCVGRVKTLSGLSDLAEAFVVEEEEELVLEDGAAEVHAELVAVEGGLLEGNDVAGVADGGGLEEAGGVEVGVADELVDRGVELVGSACGGDVDGGAGGAAVLRALVVGDDLELRDGVGRNGDDLVVEALVALAVGVVVHAVEQEVVEHAALAVDVVGAGAHEAVDGAGGRGRGGLADAGDQAEQVGVVAADERKRGALISVMVWPRWLESVSICSATSLTSTVVVRTANLQREVDALTAHQPKP